MNRCRWLVLLVLLALSAVALNAQPPVTLSPLTQKYIRVNSPRVVLTHVRVIDGTGKPAVDDQNMVIEGGKIVAVQPGADVASSNGATVLDLRGYTVMPGIVGMHNHLYHIARPDLEASGSWEAPLLLPQMAFSSPRMYLAAGVTTMRTTGSVEPYADLNLKKMIDSGLVPGPHIDVTGPYLEGPNDYLFMQMHQLTGPEDARRLVNYWADQASWAAIVAPKSASVRTMCPRWIAFAVKPLRFIVNSSVMDLLDMSGRTAVTAFLLFRALQQRGHANLDCAFAGPPKVQLAGAKPRFHLGCGGRLQEAVLGEGDDVHLGATIGAPGESCFGAANHQECVGFYSDSGRPLHHGSLRLRSSRWCVPLGTVASCRRRESKVFKARLRTSQKLSKTRLLLESQHLRARRIAERNRAGSACPVGCCGRSIVVDCRKITQCLFS